MKSRKIETVRKCSFCGGAVKVTHGLTGVPFLFFKCKDCKAIMSAEPKKAIGYFNKRVREC